MELTEFTTRQDGLTLINLDARHLNDALVLSEEAHWNQTPADWQMMMEAGDAIGFQSSTGRIVASALALPYGSEFGWISMVLVSLDWRKKGLATKLLHACIDIQENGGRAPVLDATPAGEHVYRPLGFVPHFGLTRWQHNDVGALKVVSTGVVTPTPIEADRIFEIDAKIFGGERKIVLQHLMDHSNAFSIMQQDGKGYLLGRDGRVATQIGPIMAADAPTALSMLDAALSKLPGAVFIDACDHQVALTARLEHYGFTKQRPFLRMAKGGQESIGIPAKFFAIAGPELG
jgi:GNAT superfamily N-acetyltransferase